MPPLLGVPACLPVVSPHHRPTPHTHLKAPIPPPPALVLTALSGPAELSLVLQPGPSSNVKSLHLVHEAVGLELDWAVAADKSKGNGGQMLGPPLYSCQRGLLVAMGG